jgi:hypothetical protein
MIYKGTILGTGYSELNKSGSPLFSTEVVPFLHPTTSEQVRYMFTMLIVFWLLPNNCKFISLNIFCFCFYRQRRVSVAQAGVQRLFNLAILILIPSTKT